MTGYYVKVLIYTILHLHVQYPTQLWSENCLAEYTLPTDTQHFCHLERSQLSLLCGIVCKAIRWSLCELKRDLLIIILLVHLQR